MLTGSVTDASFTSFNIRVYQSNSLFSSHKVRLNFTGGKSSFKQMIFLPSGRHIYKIVYVLSGTSTYSLETDDIVVGDVYLIQGQSNAVAASYNKFDPSYYDKYCRSFGNSSTSGSAVLPDTNWYRTYADGSYTRGSVGQWGAVMAKVLVDSFETPICIINGAVGGTRITQHQPDPSNLTNLATIYGRLLYRVQKADLQNQIRGIIYFQGESDGGNAVLHDTLFQKLHSYWQRDFPGFEKLYVIQVRSGCGGPSIQLRDKQRLFEEVLENCQTVSANGLNNHDGCHYGFANGYESLGHQMAALLGRDYYKSSRKHINAPTIKACHFSNSSQTEITLDFKYSEDSIYADSSFHKLFRMEGDATVQITSGFIRDNQVVLQLNKSSCTITGLTYDGLARSQPWVKGGTGMGLVSFYNIPVDLPGPQSEYQVCKNADVTIGTKAISGCTYLWKKQPVGTSYNTSEISITADTNYHYSLYTTYDKSACVVVDTFDVYVSPDKISIPELGSDQTICKGQQTSFSPDTAGFESFIWAVGKNKLQSESYVADSNQFIRLHSKSRQGCSYFDSVQVVQRSPEVSLPISLIICPGTDTLIEIADTFYSYIWNGDTARNSFLVEQGDLILHVLDSFNCPASDSQFIETFQPRIGRSLVFDVCNDDSVIYPKPINVQRWWHEGLIAGVEVVLKPPSLAILTIEDSNSCMTADTIEVNGYQLPTAPSFIDTSFCSGDTLKLSFDNQYDSILWDNNLLTKESLSVFNPGIHQLKQVDSNSCSWEGTIHIVENPVPSLLEFHDSVLCVDSIWRIALPSKTVIKINDVVLSDEWVISQAGKYRIEATNQFACQSNKSIDIEFVDCGLSAKDISKTPKFAVYPNPVNNVVTVYKLDNTFLTAELYGIRGDLIERWNLMRQVEKIPVNHLADGTYQLRIDDTWLWLVIKR